MLSRVVRGFFGTDGVESDVTTGTGWSVCLATVGPTPRLSVSDRLVTSRRESPTGIAVQSRWLGGAVVSGWPWVATGRLSQLACPRRGRVATGVAENGGAAKRQSDHATRETCKFEIGVCRRLSLRIASLRSGFGYCQDVCCRVQAALGPYRKVLSMSRPAHLSKAVVPRVSGPEAPG